MCEILEVDYQLTLELDYKHPANFYVRNCFGNFVYFLTRSREVAQMTSDEMFGVGHYRVSSGKMSKDSGTNTVRGVLNSKSRQGHKTRGK